MLDKGEECDILYLDYSKALLQQKTVKNQEAVGIT